MDEEELVREIGDIISNQIVINYEDTTFRSPSALEESIVFENEEFVINDYGLFLNDGTRFIEGQTFIDNAPEEAESKLEELISTMVDEQITDNLNE